MVRQSGVKPLRTVEEGAEAILSLAASEEVDGCSGESLARLEHRPAAGSVTIEAPKGRALNVDVRRNSLRTGIDLRCSPVRNEKESWPEIHNPRPIPGHAGTY